MDPLPPENPVRSRGRLSAAWFFGPAAGVVLAWIIFQLGWMTAHVFNATRFILYDPGSYLYAVGRWQAGEALYRDFAWQYGPLALGWYRAFAAVGGNSPLTLVVAGSVAFAVAWVLVARLVVQAAGPRWGGALAVAGLLPVMSASGPYLINGPHGAIEMLLLAMIAWTLTKNTGRRPRAWLLGVLVGLLQWVRFGPHLVALAAVLMIAAWQRWPHTLGARGLARELGAFAGRLLAGYVIVVVPLAVWFFRTLPPPGAGELLWPAYMVRHYPLTYPHRWPQIASAAEFGLTWLPALVGTGLALLLPAAGLRHNVAGTIKTSGDAGGGLIFSRSTTFSAARGCCTTTMRSSVICGWPGRDWPWRHD